MKTDMAKLIGAFFATFHSEHAKNKLYLLLGLDDLQEISINITVRRLLYILLHVNKTSERTYSFLVQGKKKK
jgi:hypothetical protein